MEFGTLSLATSNSTAGLLSTQESNSEAGLLSNINNSSECSILTVTGNNGGIDAFAGKDIFGTPDFSNMDESFFANAGEAETAGSVAYGNTETAGSIACGAETAGSVASASVGGDCGSACSDGGFSSMC